MSLLRKLPFKYRGPIMHHLLMTTARLRSRHWRNRHPEPGSLLVSGFVGEPSGVGEGARLSIAGFERAGFTPRTHDIRECYRHYIRGSGTFPTTERGGVWFIHANAQECLLAMMSYPAATWRSKYVIGYWAWETTRISPIWIWSAQFFDEIWVPSGFVRDVMEASFREVGKAALSERIRVMPHPVAATPGAAPDRARFGLKPGSQIALCLFDMRSGSTRKNPWATLDAWIEAFPEPRPDVDLYLKVGNLKDDPASAAALSAKIRGRTDIHLFDRRLDDLDMKSFIASFDFIVSLHRAEGFGLTLAEAMAHEVRVIATGWSGNMQFMTAANSYPVPYEIVPVRDPNQLYGNHTHPGGPPESWAEPDVAAAGRIIREAFADPRGAEKIALAKADIAETWRPWQASCLPASTRAVAL